MNDGTLRRLDADWAVSVAPDGTIRLGPRTIPPPVAISEQAGRVVAATRITIPACPRRDDTDAWRTFVAELDAACKPLVDRALQLSNGRATVHRQTVAGVPVAVGTPVEPSKSSHAGPILTVHGGGFLCMGGPWVEAEAALTAAEWGCVTYSVDYRMAPDHPHPSGLDDVTAVYRSLVDRYDPEDIVVAGSSAGANIACATVLRARDEGMPLPAALILNSPATDLTESGDTFHTLRQIDPRAPVSLSEMFALHIGAHDARDPYVSPEFADFKAGFPPTYIQSGTRDLLLSSSVRLHRALRAGSIEAELHIWDGAPHGGFGFDAPETAQGRAEQIHFVAKRRRRGPLREAV